MVQPTNAQEEVFGQVVGSGGGGVGPTSATQSTTFTVTRLAGGSITAPLVIADDCGDWSTFVGGGPNAF